MSKFKPGKSGNPKGRPLGAKHKFSEDFITAMAEDFAEHGADVIQLVREEKPAEYLRVCAKLMPRDIAAPKLRESPGRVVAHVYRPMESNEAWIEACKPGLKVIEHEPGGERLGSRKPVT